MAHGHNNPGHFGIRTKQHKLIFFYGTDYTDTHNNRRVTNRDGNRFWKNDPGRLGVLRSKPGSPGDA